MAGALSALCRLVCITDGGLNNAYAAEEADASDLFKENPVLGPLPYLLLFFFLFFSPQLLHHSLAQLHWRPEFDLASSVLVTSSKQGVAIS